MGNLPTTKLFKNCVNQEQCKASFEWLRDAARNRDAHQYAKDVRALQFYTIEALIVPMLNTALNTIDWEEQPDTFSK